MTNLEGGDFFVGLTGLKLSSDEIDLGDGISLSRTYAKFLSPLTLVNTELKPGIEMDPVTGEPMFPKPAMWHMSQNSSEITSQIRVPATYAEKVDGKFEVARFIVSIMRLWVDPSIGLHVVSNTSFSRLCGEMESNRVVVFPVETFPRQFQLMLSDEDSSSAEERVGWVKENWRVAHGLYRSSPEFRMALDSLDQGQFINNHALALVSLWGSLEALFSPSTSELKFRVSALIASYLENPGPGRLQMQKRVAKLYDMRSAAAHGKPRHDGNHLLETFDIVRKVLIKMIRRNSVPTKEDLEGILFGVS